MQWSGFYTGERFFVSLARGRVEVHPQLSIEPSLELNWLDLPQQTHSGQYNQHVARTRVTYTMTPRAYVSGLLQYSTGSQTVSANFRLRWEWAPGSEWFDRLHGGPEHGARRALVGAVDACIGYQGDAAVPAVVDFGRVLHVVCGGEITQSKPPSMNAHRSSILRRTETEREIVCVQPANSFLANQRASLARCGPSTSDPAMAPSNSTISARAVAFGSFTPAAFVHSRNRSVNHSR